MKRFVLLISIFSIFMVSCVSELKINTNVQDNTITSNILKEADEAYKNKDYKTAYEDYKMFYQSYSNSKETERVLYRIIVISYKEGKWQEFSLYTRKFLSRYMKSPYKSSVLGMQASFYQMKGLTVKALESIIKAWPYIRSEKEDTILRRQVDKIMKKKKKSDNEEIYRLCWRYRKTEISEYILYLLGKETGKKINKYWEALYEINPSSDYLVNTGIKKKIKINKKDFSIGIMIPMRGINEQEKAIYNGIKMALKEYGLDSRYVVYADTKRDPYAAAIKVQALINKYGVNAIVGPVYSDVVLPVSLYASINNIPVISPLATNQRLYDISNNVFLINNTYLPVAKTLAEYAASIKDTVSDEPTRIAVIYPDTYKGRTLADYFIQFLRKNGKDIVVAVSYNPDTSDYKKPIKQLLSSNPNVIFVPAESKEIPLIAPQLLYHYIEEWQSRVEEMEKDTLIEKEVLDSLKEVALSEVLEKIAILGSDGWLDNNVLRMPSQYTRRVVACKLPFENTEEFIKFGKRYYKIYKEEPTISAALGYDAMASVLSLWKKGITKDLKENLKNESYKGIIGSITLPNVKGNLPLYIIKHGKKEILQIDKEVIDESGKKE